MDIKNSPTQFVTERRGQKGADPDQICSLIVFSAFLHLFGPIILPIEGL